MKQNQSFTQARQVCALITHFRTFNLAHSYFLDVEQFESLSSLQQKWSLSGDLGFKKSKLMTKDFAIKIDQSQITLNQFLNFSSLEFGGKQYLNLRKKSENLFSQITQEPINYPSNVQGGYGFFNTHIPDVRFFLLNNLEEVQE